MQALSLDQIQRIAPSVFAQEAFHATSEKYRFFPTVDVVEGLLKNGFVPVKAQQSLTRTEGKENYARHMIRFRHSDMNEKLRDVIQPGKHVFLDPATAPEVPEIVLLNSHDGTSSYQLSLGIFRLACCNGLMVKSASVADLRVRHVGHENLIDDVIDASFKIIDEAPKAIEQIQSWRGITLDREEQAILARAGLAIRDTSLQIQDAEILHTRRFSDQTDGSGKRDLWKTMNVIQENLIKGGIRGRNASNTRTKLRGINSVDGDSKFNRALWSLTEEMAALKAA